MELLEEIKQQMSKIQKDINKIKLSTPQREKVILVNNEIQKLLNKILFVPETDDRKSTLKNLIVLAKEMQNFIWLSEPDYKYGKDKNHWHAFKTKHLDDKENNLLKGTENLTGDKLKRKIVENIKNYIESSLNGDEKKSMKDITDSIKKNPAYTEILAKGTGIMTRTFGLETSSQKAVDKMLHEAEEQKGSRPRPK